ncbi:hypothetical protein [Accumulibacter sp.]|uniref:hypothetical protein n=1 Tax=Accumulibacter sp. TaxID=2053492 RepID=UPI0026176879|nr:hypothetical protein [Accumulibacter sp.]
MSLAIERLRARFRSPLPLPDERRDAWLRACAAADGEALSAGLVGDDEWLFIGRLPLALRWSIDAGAEDVGAQWQGELRRAIARTMSGGGESSTLRYASRRAALTDLLYRSALGECHRQWAWQRMGLIARAGQEAEAVLAAGTALLVGEPSLVWPVIHRLMFAEPDTAAFSALLRALPAAAWDSLLAASPRTAAYVDAGRRVLPTPGRRVAGDDDAAWSLADDPQTRQWLHWAAARAPFAARHVDLLSVLLAALKWPAEGMPPAVLRARLATVRAELAAAVGEAGARRWVSASRPAEAPSVVPLPTATAGMARDGLEEAYEPQQAHRLPDLPELPEAGRWETTDWGGLLFWLGRLPASGALDWLAAQPEVAPDGLAMLLRGLADALGVPAGDAARAAFCGGEVPAGDLPARLAEYAAGLVDGWAAWLAEAAPEMAAPRLATVCRRRGRLRCEPGWIELVLPLDSVDVSTRRLGLDLDPGWLPWLACVLRIRYE